MEHTFDAEFFKKLNATIDYNEFIIAIATKVITDENLLDYDEKKLTMLFYDMAYTNSMSLKDFTTRIKKFRQAIPNFLMTLEKVLDMAEKMGSDFYKFKENETEALKDLPPLADFLDQPEVITFIRQLDKDLYNYTEAAQLLGLTRQTVSSYTNDKNHILKKIHKGKSWYVTKESMVLYYRDRNLKDRGGLPF